MSKSVISSINLCPINFKAFGEVNRITENMEATLLFSKIKFHQTNSLIESDGKTWIIRSRKQLAEWFQFTEKKVDALLSLLDEKGLVQKIVRLWHGKKALMLHASTEIMSVPIHHQKFSSLVEYIGDIHSAIIFSKIAFHFNNSQIVHDHKKWCSIKKEVLSNWASISVRKLDRILEELVKNGILLKKNFIWYGKRQVHFHIPNFAKEVLYEHMSENHYLPVATSRIIPEIANSTNKHLINAAIEKEEGRGQIEKVLPYTPICLSPSAKKGISIRIRSNTKKTNNNTVPQSKRSHISDISLMTSTLSFRQERYLKAALENTINRSQVNVSNKAELFEELKFSVSNTEQHKSVHSFPHAVSRCMKIVAQSNWRTPKGFYNYSNTGQSIKEKTAMRDRLWDQQKQEEKKIAETGFSNSLRKQPEINSEATEQGIKLAKRVLELKSSKNNTLAAMIINQIYDLISKGANGKSITSIFNNKNNM